MKTIAVIPALNEEKHIVEVINGASKYVDFVVVADGGSKDKTVDLAFNAGAGIYINKYPGGIGSNLQNAFRNIYVMRPDAVVLMDGDGQHNPDEIPQLLQPIKDGQADVVMGNRTILRGMPPYRVFGNGVLTAVANYKARKQFVDSMSGYWAIKYSAIPKLTENGWGVYTEMLMKIRCNGHNLVSVPVQPIYHDDYQDNSTLPPFGLGIRLLFFILKWRLLCRT